MGFPSTLRELRLSKQLSQRALADELEVSHALIARYERGTRKPSFDMLCAIANYFHVSLNDLLADSEEAVTPEFHLPDDERRLLRAYYEAGETGRRLAIEILEALREP